ncbi:hypothetical protein MUG91_G242n33 [Manis pentadactyla]|nr:hypothetical protein MUG91_G242n33 [Manis pentadactyla]
MAGEALSVVPQPELGVRSPPQPTGACAVFPGCDSPEQGSDTSPRSSGLLPGAEALGLTPSPQPSCSCELSLRPAEVLSRCLWLSSLSHLLSLLRPSSLRQYLSFGNLPPSQEQQPNAGAELDHKVSP